MACAGRCKQVFETSSGRGLLIVTSPTLSWTTVKERHRRLT